VPAQEPCCPAADAKKPKPAVSADKFSEPDKHREYADRYRQGLTTWGDCDNLKVIGRQTGQLIQKSKDEESTFREALQR